MYCISLCSDLLTFKLTDSLYDRVKTIFSEEVKTNISEIVLIFIYCVCLP